MSLLFGWSNEITNMLCEGKGYFSQTWLIDAYKTCGCLQMQEKGVTHHGPMTKVLYFTGATNILYTFGSHAVTV